MRVGRGGVVRVRHGLPDEQRERGFRRDVELPRGAEEGVDCAGDGGGELQGRGGGQVSGGVRDGAVGGRRDVIDGARFGCRT